MILSLLQSNLSLKAIRKTTEQIKRISQPSCCSLRQLRKFRDSTLRTSSSLPWHKFPETSFLVLLQALKQVMFLQGHLLRALGPGKSMKKKVKVTFPRCQPLSHSKQAQTFLKTPTPTRTPHQMETGKSLRSREVVQAPLILTLEGSALPKIYSNLTLTLHQTSKLSNKSSSLWQQTITKPWIQRSAHLETTTPASRTKEYLLTMPWKSSIREFLEIMTLVC